MRQSFLRSYGTRNAQLGHRRAFERHRSAAAGAVATLVLAGLLAFPVGAVDIVVATGVEGDVYHQVGRAICSFLRRKAEGVTCLPQLSAAGDTTVSIANLNNVRGGAVEFGLAQADAQLHAVEHSGPFRFMDATHENLRATFSLHSETFTLLARAGSKIRDLDGLKGRRVNIGSPNSPTRRLMDQVMAAKGWSKRDFPLAEELQASQQSLAFCHERVEAMVYTVTHPDDAVRRVAELCDGVVLSVIGPDIDKLVEETAYFSRAVVPGGLYAQNDAPVATFGVIATLVSSADVDDETVYAVVKTVFDNFDDFRKAHPAFGTLEPARMVREGLTAPVHDGALRYYEEKGLM